MTFAEMMYCFVRRRHTDRNSPLWQKHISDPSLAARATHLTAALQECLEGQTSEMTPLAVSLQAGKKADDKLTYESSSQVPHHTFESARSSLPVNRALVKQASPVWCQVFPAKHSAILDFSQRLWLHLVVYVSETRGLLREINQCVHLDNGVFNQT